MKYSEQTIGMPTDRLTLSLAVVTRNRPDSLRRTLASIRAQSIQPFEIVISDDSDRQYIESTRAVASEFGCSYVEGPKRGLYANRNFAARRCRGTHVRTVDDDHEFPLDHLERCLEALRSDASSIWVIGEYMSAEPQRFAAPETPGQLNARGFASIPPDPQNSWALADGAHIIPTEVVEKGIAYSEEFVFGASYLEYGARLRWLGYRIRQVNTTYVIHHFNPTTRSFLDAELETAARLFAAMCFVFRYQPSARNWAYFTHEVFRQLASGPSKAARVFGAALRAFRAHANDS